MNRRTSSVRCRTSTSARAWVRQRTDKRDGYDDAHAFVSQCVEILRRMKPRASHFPLGSEYDNFLFAPIGDDRNGMPLSVVSLLGRMDLDPWEEAARLAGLSADAAVQKLALLLRALPDQSMLQADPDGAAIRLIALLPRRNDARA